MRAASRRQFLRGAGGAALLLPPLVSLGGRAAQAAATPKRVLFLYVPQQEDEDFLPRAGFSLAGTYFEPLTALQRKLLFVQNLKGRSGHQGGHSEFLSGWASGSFTSWRPKQGPSIDQYIAKRLGTVTPLPSLELTLTDASRATRDDGIISWTENTLAVPAIPDPRRGFERVFGPVGGTAPSSSATDAAALRRKQQKSLLDVLIDDYQWTTGRLAAPDRRLLDAHLTLLREQEKRLQVEAQRPPLSCQAPASAAPATTTTTDFPTRVRQHLDTIAAAFRCDATRVASLSFGISQDGRTYPWVGMTDDFHQVAHRAVPDARTKFFSVRKWQAQQIAYLAQQLDAIPEGSGTVLDNTVIAWMCELGYWPSTMMGNDHLRAQVASLLIGGCGGFFGTGRVVDVKGADYCNLLLTFAHAMGFADLTQFGVAGTRALSELRP